MILILISCSKEIPFDKELWNTRTDVFYDYREHMITDLAENHLKSTMMYNEIINLLGSPSNFGDPKKAWKVDFEIIEKYGWDIDPIESRYLSITLDKDSTLDHIYLNIWRVNSGTETIEFKIQ